MKKHFDFFSTVLFIALILDILTKFFVRKNLLLNESIPLIKNFIYITRVHNTGSLWGIFQDNNTLLIITSIAVIIVLVYYFKELTNTKASAFFTGLIFSGAIGNLIDRVLYGHVIDFIDFRFWPVFNMADTSLSIGILGIIFLNIFNKDNLKR